MGSQCFKQQKVNSCDQQSNIYKIKESKKNFKSEYNEEQMEQLIREYLIENDEINRNIISLKEKLEKYKLMFEHPRAYLSNSFIEMKQEIDEEFSKKLSNTSNRKTKSIIKMNWVEVVSYVKSFENECLNKQRTDEFSNEIRNKHKNKIQLLENLLISIKEPLNEHIKYCTDGRPSESMSNDDRLKDSIARFERISDEAIMDLNKILFLNRTVVFLGIYSWKIFSFRFFSDIEPNLAVGKLVVIRNYFISKEDVFQVYNNRMEKYYFK